MEKITDFISKISTYWVAVGIFLTTLGVNSVSFLNLDSLFSQATIDETLTVIGAVTTYIGYLKGQVIKTVNTATVKVLSAGQKLSFALNPFRNTL